MSIYLDTTGEPTLGIGICARCSRKFKLAELHPDPNYPNLMVCKDDTLFVALVLEKVATVVVKVVVKVLDMVLVQHFLS